MATRLMIKDKVIATRNWGGPDRGVLIHMNVTKEQWNSVKKQMANTDTMMFDVATAGMIVNDWVKSGATVIWKTAKDWNQQARDLESHRFRDEVGGFEAGIDSARSNAKDTSKSTFKTVK